MPPAGVTRVDAGTGGVANATNVALEKLTRLSPAGLPADLMLARFEGELSVEHVQSVDPDILENTRNLGERWRTQRLSCVLCVPSVIAPEERSLVLHPLHPEPWDNVVDPRASLQLRRPTVMKAPRKPLARGRGDR